VINGRLAHADAAGVPIGDCGCVGVKVVKVVEIAGAAPAALRHVVRNIVLGPARYARALQKGLANNAPAEQPRHLRARQARPRLVQNGVEIASVSGGAVVPALHLFPCVNILKIQLAPQGQPL
jgi:hypothetical protein